MVAWGRVSDAMNERRWNLLVACVLSTGGLALAGYTMRNLGGTVGPYYVGYMKDVTGNFAGGLYGLALLSLIAALVCAFFLHIPDRIGQRERVGEALGLGR